ncbi:MAG: hypothetical protein SFY66_15170 [Oculatellaceae cyanobacterium bins.114]|nr:hypothetical protein [Oculatellaceae cyanobacterium bins.114]
MQFRWLNKLTIILLWRLYSKPTLVDQTDIYPEPFLINSSTLCLWRMLMANVDGEC